MRSRLRMIRNTAFAACIIAALGIGAQRVMASNSCRDCTQPPDIECKHLGWPDMHEFCDMTCKGEPYNCQYGGQCNVPLDRCDCLEK